MIRDPILEELERELARRETQENSAAMQTAFPNDDPVLAQMEAELARREAAEIAAHRKEPESDFVRKTKLAAEQFLKGGLDIVDFLAQVGTNLPQMPYHDIEEGNPNILGNASDLYQETIHPKTGAERVIAKAARAAPAGAIGGLGGIGTAALTGATSAGLEEAGMSPLAADITSIVGAPGAAMLGRAAARKIIPRGLAGKEEKMARYLQENIGKEHIPKVSERLKNPPKYEQTGYQPMTAEIAESPTFSQLHRLQYEMPGSGLPQHAGKQNDLLMTAIDEATSNAPYGRNIEAPVNKKLKELIKTRHEQTNPGYSEVEKMREPLNPKNLKSFLKEHADEVGDIENDLEAVKRFVRPKGKISPKDREYRKLYEAIEKPEMLEKLPPPKSTTPSIRRLSKATRGINAKLEKLAPTEKARAKMLREAKEAINKDLEAVPLHKETTQKYRELSEPISHIEKHPFLRTVVQEKKLKRKLNTHMGRLFDTASKDNVKALKHAIGDDTKTWEHVREASVEHFIKSVSNAGAEGKGHVLSYPKMRKFMNMHHDALSEMLDKDQMKLIYEIEGIARGQNRAKTLGTGVGSPTHARLRADLGLKESTGMKAAELAASTQSGVVKKGIGVFLKNWGNNHHEQMMNVLNRALIEPEYAHKLLNLKPKNQLEFNKFINSSLRRTPVLVSKRHEEDDK